MLWGVKKLVIHFLSKMVKSYLTAFLVFTSDTKAMLEVSHKIRGVCSLVCKCGAVFAILSLTFDLIQSHLSMTKRSVCANLLKFHTFSPILFLKLQFSLMNTR